MSIFQSPNEIARLQQKNTQNARILRVQNVRKQERAIATQRRERFKDASRTEWTRQLDSLFVQIIYTVEMG